ncbi:MAG TPA: dienelactone hydrolase family protein [Planctomycetota bacterium]|nr:dienelactone hydrolase family protein [Planctomycetota bacterium]
MALSSCASPSPGGDASDDPPRYHTAPAWTRPEMKTQHEVAIPSCLELDDGRRVATPEDWHARRRPELVRHWTRILGKLEPSPEDRRWFGDITKAVVDATEEAEGYTRVRLRLPMETDFLQPHLLLIPKGQGAGPFPAVIAWTSSTPDYTKPEEWWGAWLARRGVVVLTGWSFIRNYRDGTTYRTGADERLHGRFGRWMPMGKMVHDVRREIEYLKSRPEVDGTRIGFIGFSLGAKAALYAAAFVPELAATVSIDPHISLHGATNWEAPWYLDWKRKYPDIRTDDYPVEELRGTVWSLLDADPARPGFERNHHEILALCAPRPFLLIGGSAHKQSATHSDDRQSRGYVRRAKEVYALLGVPDRLEFAETDEGHAATGPKIDEAWRRFLLRWLKAP